VKKSHANIPAAWPRRNAVQPGPPRRGAGPARAVAGSRRAAFCGPPGGLTRRSALHRSTLPDHPTSRRNRAGAGSGRSGSASTRRREVP
jgi:hypothetical protein